MADLTDFEQMVLALVHPLVQVYTIPTTGELAYVGHAGQILKDRLHADDFKPFRHRPYACWSRDCLCR